MIVRRGLVYPGHPPRELRFVDSAESGETVDVQLFKKMVRWIMPTIEDFRKVYVTLHENYFAPVSSPVLLAPHAFVTRGRSVYLMDDKGSMIRIDDTSGSQGVRFIRVLERARVRVVYGRCYVDDGSVLTLAPLSAIVLSKNWHMMKF